MRNLLLFAAAMLAAALSCNATKVITGRVLSGSVGKSGSPQSVPLANVIVTDGFSVVTTDDNGNFSLPSNSSAKYLSVTKPDSYGADNLFQQVTPNKENYEFSLTKTSPTRESKATFLHVNSPSSNTGEWFENLKKYTSTAKPDFVVFTGQSDSYSKIAFSELSSPTFAAGAMPDTNTPNGQPEYFSFDYGSTHYALIGGTKKNAANAIGWLLKDLSLSGKAKPTVLLLSGASYNPSTKTLDIFGSTADLADLNLRAIVLGGWDTNFFLNGGTTSPSVISTASPDYGGVDHSPASFREVSVSQRGDISTQTVETFVKGFATIAYPSDSAYLELDKLRIYANTYTSNSPITRVRASVVVNGVEMGWQELNRNSTWGWSGFAVVGSVTPTTRIDLTLQAFALDGSTFEDKRTTHISATPPNVEKSKSAWGNLLSTPSHKAWVNQPFGGKLKHIWCSNSQGNSLFASPLAVNNLAITTSFNEPANNKSTISAFDISNGKAVWHAFTTAPITNTFCLNNHMVVATDVLGNIYGIDPSNGKRRWNERVNAPLIPGITSGSVLSDSVYYTGSGNALLAVSCNTGEMIWEATNLFNPDGNTSTKTIGNGVLLLSSNLRGLYAFDAHTGKPLWKHMDEKLFLSEGTASYYNGRFHLVSNSYYYSIVPQTGEIASSLFLPYAVDANTTPIYDDGILYFGSSNSGFVAYDIKNESPKWVVETGLALTNTNPNSDVPEKAVEGSPLLINGFVIFGSLDGFVYVVQASTGEVVQRINLGSPILGTPAISGNILLVADYSGNMNAFELTY